MNEEFYIPRRRWGKSNIEIPVIPFGDASDEEACGCVSRQGR